ncbi:hypothetical protein [Hydrogenophaga sp. 2FB]|uniref:hypothetical protein n=1 Tax=Hydrogenophaga sp. 2FB TaxID=2502187 RepID=UPI0010F5FE88|nr:hypothetical protein [Hydrogenophaga sp. 2FB]
MADLLPGFKYQTKLSQLLIIEYEFEARRHGDAHIKNEAATAKRTATTLCKAAGQVRGMDPKDSATLRAAASVLRRHAAELGELCKWAKAYHTYTVQYHQAEALAEINAFAHARWGDDQQAHVLETALLQTLQKTQDGARALGHFLHSQGLYTHVQLEGFSLAVDWPCADQTKLNERQRTADILLRLKRKDDVYEGRMGWTCLVGKQSYERYREFVAATAARALEPGRVAGASEDLS